MSDTDWSTSSLLSSGASFYGGEFFKWGDELGTAPTTPHFVDGGRDFYFDANYLNDASELGELHLASDFTAFVTASKSPNG